MNIFFTSDQHFYHSNIISYCNRPFKSMEEMNQVMIRKWNERVKKEDLVYHLGDICMKHAPGETPDAPKQAWDIIRPQLNGEVILLLGNHDSRNNVKSILESAVINYGGKRIFLIHDPKWARKEFYWNLCGHCHGNKGRVRKWGEKNEYYHNDSFIIDIGVDCWNFYPVQINEINSAFEGWLKHGTSRKYTKPLER